MAGARRIEELGEDAVIALFAEARACVGSGDRSGGSAETSPAEAGPVPAGLIVPNGDDAAAYLSEPGECSVVTTDTLVEGVHFDLAYTRPREVGRKWLAVNLSDLAAMGAAPRWALLSVVIAGEAPEELARELGEGARAQAGEHGVTIIGGNVSRTRGPTVLTAVLIGAARPERLVRRRGARPGDGIFVTGSLGDARGGLMRALRRGRPEDGDPAMPLLRALVDPVPRVSAGLVLAERGLARSMCDVSDGFTRDLGRLLVADGLGARIEAAALPISEALRAFADGAAEDPLALALAGGEDYELLFTSDPSGAAEVRAALAGVGTPVTEVGRVTAEPGLRIVAQDGTLLAPPGGHDHFRAG